MPCPRQHWGQSRHMNHTAKQTQRLQTLPKAEVHVHLEGCFEASLLEQWARKFGEPMPRPRESLFRFEGLADFLHFLDWACGLVRTREELVPGRLCFQPTVGGQRRGLCRPDLQPDALEALAQTAAADDRRARCRVSCGRAGRPATGGPVREPAAHPVGRCGGRTGRPAGRVAASACRGLVDRRQRGGRRTHRAAFCRGLQARRVPPA